MSLHVGAEAKAGSAAQNQTLGSEHSQGLDIHLLAPDHSSWQQLVPQD